MCLYITPNILLYIQHTLLYKYPYIPIYTDFHILLYTMQCKYQNMYHYKSPSNSHHIYHCNYLYTDNYNELHIGCRNIHHNPVHNRRNKLHRNFLNNPQNNYQNNYHYMMLVTNLFLPALVKTKQKLHQL